MPVSIESFRSLEPGGQKVIYDIGANNGDDVLYYLEKADRVIAVEANPSLCDIIRDRFSREIKEGRLVVENCVLTPDRDGELVTFYMHKTHHVLSQFTKPKQQEKFDKMELPCKSVRRILQDYGTPFYFKIDVEGYDYFILKALFECGLRPEFVSAESHKINVLLVLITLGGYKQFKVTNGAEVSTKYANCLIKTASGSRVFSFASHSTGPFGEDLAGDWLSVPGVFSVLACSGLGWMDIHAWHSNAVKTGSRANLSWRLKYCWYWFFWRVFSVYFRVMKGHRAIPAGRTQQPA